MSAVPAVGDVGTGIQVRREIVSGDSHFVVLSEINNLGRGPHGAYSVRLTVTSKGKNPEHISIPQLAVEGWATSNNPLMVELPTDKIPKLKAVEFRWGSKPSIQTFDSSRD
jgi:hypothetical protein